MKVHGGPDEPPGFEPSALAHARSPIIAPIVKSFVTVPPPIGGPTAARVDPLPRDGCRRLARRLPARRGAWSTPALLRLRFVCRNGLSSLPRSDRLEELIHVERLQADPRLPTRKEDEVFPGQRLCDLQLHQGGPAAPGERLVLFADP